MESLVATRDPVFRQAARLAGFADARVVDTRTGKMVFVRHRHAASWGPFAHVAKGDAVFNEFFGCAFWERADVLALLDRKEELRADGLDRVEADIGKDFRRDFRRLVVGRPDGKNDVVEAMARMRGVRL